MCSRSGLKTLFTGRRESSRHKAKFVRAEAGVAGQTSAHALLKENVRAGGARGNNPDLIPDTGLS